MNLVRCTSACVTAAIALSSWVAGAQSTASLEPDPSFLPYTDVSQSILLSDERRIHFTCMGRGSPTVILAAGAGDWGLTWNKVQPEVAKKTRVCAWDRAGFGLSDASPARQTIAATAADLSAALTRSGFVGPYIMVGHSLAGLELLLLADQGQHRIAGMVLVDPSIPDQMRHFGAAAPAVAAFIPTYFSQAAAYFRRCSEAARAGRVAGGAADPEGCFNYPPQYPSALSAALAQADSAPARFSTRASFFEALTDSFALAVNPGRGYGAMPLVVLTAAEPDTPPPGTPAEVAAQAAALPGVLRRGHAEIAALSTQGVQRLVQGSSHYIQQIKPDVVVAAVGELVDRARAGSAQD